MSVSLGVLDIYVETSRRKVFAGVIEWPGWIRWGRTENAALAALLSAGPCYAAILAARDLHLNPPHDIAAFKITERHAGNATTAFGAPDAELDADRLPIDKHEHRRFENIFEASWMAFDRAVDAAGGHELRKGPHGGGRTLDKIIDHVIMADQLCLKRIGWKWDDPDDGLTPSAQILLLRKEIRAGLAASVRGELPPKGPRGGKRWTPRFFTRRVAWHAIDHAWEIEERISSDP